MGTELQQGWGMCLSGPCHTQQDRPWGHPVAFTFHGGAWLSDFWPGSRARLLRPSQGSPQWLLLVLQGCSPEGYNFKFPLCRFLKTLSCVAYAWRPELSVSLHLILLRQDLNQTQGAPTSPANLLWGCVYILRLELRGAAVPSHQSHGFWDPELQPSCLHN